MTNNWLNQPPLIRGTFWGSWASHSPLRTTRTPVKLNERKSGLLGIILVFYLIISWRPPPPGDTVLWRESVVTATSCRCLSCMLPLLLCNIQVFLLNYFENVYNTCLLKLLEWSQTVFIVKESRVFTPTTESGWKNWVNYQLIIISYMTN